MRKICSLSILVGLALLSFSSCAPRAAKEPGAKETSPSSEIRAPSLDKAPWETEWESSTKQARKEGKLVVMGVDGELRYALVKTLRDKFGLDMEAITGRGNEIVNRLFAERKAGIFSTDLYLSGTTTVTDQLKPALVLQNLEPQLVLPEVLDPKAWWKGELPFVDKDKQCFAFVARPFLPFIINASMVKDEELKSYWDLINPKWKGKIIMDDPTVAGTGLGAFAVLSYVLLSPDFYRQLARMEPTVTRDKRQVVEWVAKGKSAIGLGPGTEIVTEFQKVGAPIKGITPAEGTYITSGGGNMSLFKDAPHPNAARVFINWFLTKEGGTFYSEVAGNQSARVDVSTNHLEPISVRQPGVKYFNYIDEEFLLKKPEQVRLALEIFGPLLR